MVCLIIYVVTQAREILSANNFFMVIIWWVLLCHVIEMPHMTEKITSYVGDTCQYGNFPLDYR